jgi:hypothetical protein
MDKHFGTNNYSLWHLFKDEQRKVLGQVLRSTLEGIEISFREIYEKNYPIMSFLQSLKMPLPQPFSVATEYTVNMELKRIIEAEDLNPEKLERLINEVKKWSLKIDRGTIGFVATSWTNSLMEKLRQQPQEIPLLEKIENVLKLLIPLSVELDLLKAQNVYFTIEKERYSPMKERAEKGDDFAKRWAEAFHRLSSHLSVKVP